jgi:hypothetical protein
VQETEVDPTLLLSSVKNAEVVDARYILVKLLSEAGIYSSAIAKKINHTEKSVNMILYNFNDRLKTNRIFRITYENIRKKQGITK